MSFFFVRLFILMVFLLTIFVVLHEKAHAEVFKIYDCKNIHYDLKITKLTAYTLADCPNNDSDIAQSINEIVGYTIMPLLLIIILLISTKHLED